MNVALFSWFKPPTMGKRGPTRAQESKVKIPCGWRGCRSNKDVKSAPLRCTLPIHEVDRQLCRASLRGTAQTVRCQQLAQVGTDHPPQFLLLCPLTLSADTQETANTDQGYCDHNLRVTLVVSKTYVTITIIESISPCCLYHHHHDGIDYSSQIWNKKHHHHDGIDYSSQIWNKKTNNKEKWTQ